MISYRKLIEKLNENNISQYRLKKEGILGSATITKIYKEGGLSGESIDIKIVDKMCKLLHCQPGDILECVPDKEGYSDSNQRKWILATRKMLRIYETPDNIKNALKDFEKKSAECNSQIESLRNTIAEGEKDEEYKFSTEYLNLLQQLQALFKERDIIDDRIKDLKRAISVIEKENSN